MKTQFIQIQDIAEIDTSKVTVYDMNKRYIDRAGNMYSLRYNRETKKVEVIKVMRTTARNQTYFTQKMIENRKTSHNGDDGSESDEETEPTEQEENRFYPENATDMSSFDPDSFKNEMFRAITTHKERLAGITKNIGYAKLVMREQRELSIRMDEHLRNIDIDGLQRIDKIISAYREMTDYPRSINYYLGRLDTRARNMVGAINLEEKKLKFVMLYEVYLHLKDLFLVLSKNLSSLKEFVVEVREARYVKLTSSEKQSLSDALVSIDNTIVEIKELSERLRILEEFIFNPANFN
ncbi:MAG TPA: hypothetical protein VF857_03700 [Spirochaetota bacterium]